MIIEVVSVHGMTVIAVVGILILIWNCNLDFVHFRPGRQYA